MYCLHNVVATSLFHHATPDSESDCYEVLDHGGEPIPLPANPEPPAVPDEAPAPPVRTPSPEPRPRPSSPV